MYLVKFDWDKLMHTFMVNMQYSILGYNEPTFILDKFTLQFTFKDTYLFIKKTIRKWEKLNQERSKIWFPCTY